MKRRPVSRWKWCRSDLLKQQEKLGLDGPAGKGADLVTWPHDQLGEAVIKGLVRPLEVE